MLTVSSEVYDNDQLDQMKKAGKNVLANIVEVNIIGDSVVDQMYSSYCSPSHNIIFVFQIAPQPILLLPSESALAKFCKPNQLVLGSNARSTTLQSGSQGSEGRGSYTAK
ncbi:hypothetical protein PPTG_23370 [Phytophthora nicotianae INRA-310]|uniref:Uncharacterized protein n=1 Tax=Phytophthora nicotianae (strain INRA-310) TaxID=761204 RepID=W2PZX7_PHYN3|nr:hypothetical protein PPTG_23370 [Phytophthora nicotianae INRA-310]ETN06417.1 hypothetical protein PPTG_23370 [Phytophthora nicotianae INRA-310]